MRIAWFTSGVRKLEWLKGDLRARCMLHTRPDETERRCGPPVKHGSSTSDKTHTA